MSIWLTAAWGVTGAVAAGLVAFSVEVVSRGYKWPWIDRPYHFYPRLVVMLLSIVTGGLFVVAASTFIREPFIAFLLGFTAPTFLQRAVINFRRAEARRLNETPEDREARIEMEAERIAETRVAIRDSETSDLQGVSPYVADSLAARRNDLLGQLRVSSDQPDGEQDAS